VDKYGRKAGRWSEIAYADADTYLAHRAELVTSVGPRLEAGDTLLDLACGDGAMAAHLPGIHYRGVDSSPEMVDVARARGHDVTLADLNEYEPTEPVVATTCFRAIYYATDRRAFFARVAGYTERKLVFDLNPRQYGIDEIRTDLRAAGFDRFELHPFFSPLRRRVPGPVAALLKALERTGPLARLLLRVRFSYVCAAYRGGRNV
jgi:SAM-dependent methyltransferase